MPQFRDLVGQTFGRLKVLEQGPHRGKAICWRCSCSCGSQALVVGSKLTSGRTRSCGCIHRERAAHLNRTHGFSGTPEHVIWAAAKQRTGNPRSKDWPNYGGRGITMHPAWREDFARFLEDVGPRPSDRHTLERLDNDGNYEPGNVAWETRGVQNRNRRARADNVSGFPGVRRTKSGRWEAKHKRKHLGTFSTPEEASAAYEQARTEVETHRW